MRSYRDPVPMPVKRSEAPHAQVGRCSIWWSSAAPDAVRTKTLAAMATIKTRRYRYKVDYVRARARAESYGTAILTESPDLVSEATRKRGEIVRIFYQTMGDETVYFEVGPMHPVTASNMAYAYNHGPKVVPGVSAKTYAVKRPSDIPAHWPWPPKSESRCVVLPSQRGEPVELLSEAGEALAA